MTFENNVLLIAMQKQNIVVNLWKLNNIKLLQKIYKSQNQREMLLVHVNFLLR